MAGIQGSNLAQIEWRLLNFARLEFSSQDPRGRGTIKDEVREIVAKHQWERAHRERDPRGRTWARLSAKYRERKLADGYPDQVGVRTGEMLDKLQFIGNVQASKNKMTITYGRSAAAKQKLGWFEAGGKGRPKRKVLGMDTSLKRKLGNYLREVVRARARNKRGG